MKDIRKAGPVNSSENGSRFHEPCMSQRTNNGRERLSANNKQETLPQSCVPSEKLDELIVLYNLGQLAAVRAKCLEWVAKDPDAFLVWNILGATTSEMGNYEEARQALERALVIRPDFPEALNNLGNVLRSSKDLSSAIEVFERALEHNPQYADAAFNLGNTRQQAGDLQGAIQAYATSYLLQPDDIKTLYNLSLILKQITFTEPNNLFQHIIVSILSVETICSPPEIFKAAISLLNFENSLNLLRESPEQPRSAATLSKELKQLSELPLFLKLLELTPIADANIEKGLSKIRRDILLTLAEIKTTNAISLFQSALASQCYLNEYIYSQSDEEAVALKSLEDKVKRTLADGGQPKIKEILCLASFKALNKYEWCPSLATTPDIRNTLLQQVSNPNSENQLRQNIDSLSVPKDQVSQSVRQQYESNPYPRWTNLQLPFYAQDLAGFIQQTGITVRDNQVLANTAPKVLVAGCGTGQHSIKTASKFKDSKVLAIDLSLSSLAHAKRKTQEFGIENVNYAQADILDLDRIDDRFDIVECAGVLHHLDEPLVGWRKLTEKLKPGGLMMIGLYSQIARKPVSELREEILDNSLDSNERDIRLFREKVISSHETHHQWLRGKHEFYNLSSLKDLCFHVKEAQFSLQHIKSMLENLGLDFCGFDLPREKIAAAMDSGLIKDICDLDGWHKYEEINQSFFEEMYQFWCQKRR